MKKTALTMAISSLLLAGGAQAANVYDQNGTKLDIGGRVNGMYYGTDDNATEGDASYLRLHIAGETKVDEDLTAFGFAEYNLPVSGSDNDELRYAYAGIKHDRFGAFSYGRQDGLFTKAVNNYTDVLPEWGGDGLGKDTEVFGTGRTNGLAQRHHPGRHRTHQRRAQPGRRQGVHRLHSVRARTAAAAAPRNQPPAGSPACLRGR